MSNKTGKKKEKIQKLSTEKRKSEKKKNMKTPRVHVHNPIIVHLPAVLVMRHTDLKLPADTCLNGLYHLVLLGIFKNTDEEGVETSLEFQTAILPKNLNLPKDSNLPKDEKTLFDQIYTFLETNPSHFFNTLSGAMAFVKETFSGSFNNTNSNGFQSYIYDEHSPAKGVNMAIIRKHPNLYTMGNLFSIDQLEQFSLLKDRRYHNASHHKFSNLILDLSRQPANDINAHESNVEKVEYEDAAHEDVAQYEDEEDDNEFEIILPSEDKKRNNTKRLLLFKPSLKRNRKTQEDEEEEEDDDVDADENVELETDAAVVARRRVHLKRTKLESYLKLLTHAKKDLKTAELKYLSLLDVQKAHEIEKFEKFEEKLKCILE